MDPSTTLLTFFLETDPSVKSVQLIGSWDNFSSCNTMHRDVRRGRGQWRACHSLSNSIPNNTTSTTPTMSTLSTTTPKATNGGTANGRRTLIKTAASGGLNMGHTYYYYYEVDGCTETYNPSLPSTTNCPYLPGQTVNIINVPVEQQRLRQRSASLSSLRYEAFRTMNPNDRFIAPKPAAEHTITSVPHRLATAFTPPISRSPSPTPSHSWKRFFKRPSSRTDLRGRSSSSSIQDLDDHSSQYEHDIHMSMQSFTSAPSSSTFYIDDSSRCATPTEGTRTRDISPESLRRFLVDDAPISRPGSDHRPHCLTIPEDIAEEVDDDDDNFATSAISESFPVYTTRLSPPPSQRSDSVPPNVTQFSGLAPPPPSNASSHPMTLAPINASSATITQQPTSLPKLSIEAANPTALLSLSPDSSAYDSDEADSRFVSNYSLPAQTFDVAKNPVMSPTLAGNSPPLLPHATVETGDFASEFAWMR